jgi:hypothetical protein
MTEELVHQHYADTRGARRARPRPHRRRHAIILAALTGSVGALAGCGGSSSAVTAPRIAPAKTYSLARFQPAAPVTAGRATKIAFTIQQPSGRPLTQYRTCCDPHAGVDLIVVRSDDSHVQYDDSDIAPDGTVTQPITFPTAGRYRIIIDAYPRQTAPNAPINFQLFTWVTVHGSYHPRTVPPYSASEVIDGYHFGIQGHPKLKAIEANFLTIKVTDPAGRKAMFGSWRGALAHAIFIHNRSLDYFHTHVCSPGARYCTSALGATKVTGSSSAPGELKVGVLLPEPGTWRLFLLTYIDGRHITAPFTLNAGS